MRASSTASTAAGQAVLTAALDQDASNAKRVGEEFFGLADLLSTRANIARALTDPSRTEADKAALASKLLGSSVDPLTLKTVQVLVSGRWSSETDLAVACEELATRAILSDAGRQELLDRLEDDLFAVATFLRRNPQVRGHLSDTRGATPIGRANLAQTLFESRICSPALRLLRRTVGTSKSGRLQARLRELALAAAQLRDRDLVVVTSATPISVEQLARLRAILQKASGRLLTINVAVEPDLVGGMRILAGSDLVDGSLASALTLVRRKLAS